MSIITETLGHYFAFPIHKNSEKSSGSLKELPLLYSVGGPTFVGQKNIKSQKCSECNFGSAGTSSEQIARDIADHRKLRNH